MKAQQLIMLRRTALLLVMIVSLSAFTAVAQKGFFELPQPRYATTAPHSAAPQHKATGTGSRLYAISLYHGDDSARFLPIDSHRYSYLIMTTNLYNQDLEFGFSPGNWVNYVQYNYIYDASGNVLEKVILTRNSNTGSWVNSSKEIYTYNAGSMITNKLTQYWNPSNSTWGDNYKDIYTYDAANNLTNVLKQSIAGTNSTNNSQYSYTYNAQGKVTQEISQNGLSGTWQNMDRTDYSYDTSGMNMTGIVFYSWRNSNWAPGYRYIYTLNNAGKPMQALIDVYTTTNQWGSSERVTLTYDAAGNNTRMVTEKWFDLYGTYLNGHETIRTFNTYNQPLSITNLTWYSGAFQIGIGDSHYNYYYEPYTATSVGSIANSGANLSVYPNPVSSDLQVSLRWDAAQPFSAAITDMAGRVYSTFSAPSAKDFSTTLSLKDLPAGNYLLSIQGSAGGRASQMVTVCR